MGSPPCRHGRPVPLAAGKSPAAQTLPLCFAPAKILLATCCVHPRCGHNLQDKTCERQRSRTRQTPGGSGSHSRRGDESCAHGLISPGTAPALSARGLRRRRDGPCRAHPAATEDFPAARASPTHTARRGRRSRAHCGAGAVRVPRIRSERAKAGPGARAFAARWPRRGRPFPSGQAAVGRRPLPPLPPARLSPAPRGGGGGSLTPVPSVPVVRAWPCSGCCPRPSARRS